MCLMKDYCDFTLTKFNDIWNINIVEFFQFVAFIKEHKRRETEEMKKYMRKFQR